MRSDIKQDLQEIEKLLPDIDSELITEHLKNLQDYYFKVFSREAICRHIGGLSRLTKTEPIQVLFQPGTGGIIEFTVLAYDYPALFSLITGVFSASGFRFISGDIFTYQRIESPPFKKQHRVSALKKRLNRQPRMRKIIDYFTGYIDSERPLDIWMAEVQNRLKHIISLLKDYTPEAVNHAKQKVNEMVALSLLKSKFSVSEMLFPVYIHIDNSESDYTILHVVSEDTPFFLFALSSALSLHNVSIELVRIHTKDTKIQDDFYLADLKGNKLTDPLILNNIKLSVLLTKQFTFFLGNSPDPYKALCRFEAIVAEIITLPKKGEWYDLLSNHFLLDELAHVLGASDFLWEDFIRNQYETILPMINTQMRGKRFSKSAKALGLQLEQTLRTVKSLEEKKKKLNQFKNREIYLIDLDHILNPKSGLQDLSKNLTCLAEIIIIKAFELIYGKLTRQYGKPKSIAGLDASFSLFGLGKFGGRALGYASDIELLFIYSDNGVTDGGASISNADFFEQLVRDSISLIQVKREGIFQIDMRLRPFGKAGPLACSLENFCRYYGKAGKAHAAERLALVRLRKFGGNPEFGELVERIRDQTIYESKIIDPQDILSLRAKQLLAKTHKSKFNAKFSPGGLVDLEYSVQLLQVIHGSMLAPLRTPLIHDALNALAGAKVLKTHQAERLIQAYYFFRNLINGLRMLRGSARDLILPAADSSELVHLARRIGYEYTEDLPPHKQLLYDFETWTAYIRGFVEQHFGRNSLPTQEIGNIADIILSQKISNELIKQILMKIGFKDVDRAHRNIKHLAGKDKLLEYFTRISVLAGDMLSRKPDPDMALNNWERLVRVLDNPFEHYKLLLSQPRRLDILLSVFSLSHFLSDILIRHPEYFEWATQPDNLRTTRELSALKSELADLARKADSHESWLIQLRRFRKREILRIAIRDVYLEKPITETTLELSRLAEAIIDITLAEIWARHTKKENKLSSAFCVMALGKLGGAELNYSSDIDLIALYDDSVPAAYKAKDTFNCIFEQLTQELNRHLSEGYVYRVDLRLRPYGRSGILVPSLTSIVQYYSQKAALWEIQSLLKMRPVAGSFGLGRTLMKRIKPLFGINIRKQVIAASIKYLREKSVAHYSRRSLSPINIKIGLGGIRDIEFLVQGLQRIHAADKPEIIHGNTLHSIDLLFAAQLLPHNKAEQIKHDYIFLRRVEHYLQILEDRQTYELPENDRELEALAKRVIGVHAAAKDFESALIKCLSRVREEYVKFINMK
ncbi:MAG: glutamate-ammonia-ligase adenylyltransferase [Spirochaetales bacterium]|nr:glutamate-ammonia-ligase adenylyltransferase [Spirochaetales bacterium]